jgi:glucose-6-phosphate 1-dehydrogenase
MVKSSAARDAHKTDWSDPGTCLTVAVLGCTGDLAKKKTYPALFALYLHKHLPRGTVVVGYARSDLDDDGLRDRVRSYLKGPPETVEAFLAACHYERGAYEDAGRTGVFAGLGARVAAFERQRSASVGHRIFYLALPPSVYPPVCANIKETCMSPSPGWTRIIVEKPFGKDLSSSEALSAGIAALFTEAQLYRIDHYLGKELTQNLVVMRFANRFLAPLWNRDNISNVQIIFKEPFGTQGRGGYFDQYGIIRDIIQNHLLQLLCLVAMEKPCSLSPDDIRDEKLKVLRCVEPVSTDNVALGQYTNGTDGPAYLDDPTVPAGSRAPTFALCVLEVNNERWEGVPFIVKAGKALNEHKCEIRVQLKDVPGDLFASSRVNGRQARNEFVVRLQPDPAIYMKMTVKEPGLGMELAQSELELLYTRKYEDVSIPEAYERLILDCINGDQQHFVRRDELVAAWTIFTPLLKYIDAGGLNPELYAYGSRGPSNADKLRARAGYIPNLTAKDITWMHGDGD